MLEQADLIFIFLIPLVATGSPIHFRSYYFLFEKREGGGGDTQTEREGEGGREVWCVVCSTILVSTPY